MRYLLTIATILSAFTLMAPSASAAGTGKYCLKGPGTTIKCNYQTMASCDKAKKGIQTCVANPASTTGSGTSSNSMNK